MEGKIEQLIKKEKEPSRKELRTPNKENVTEKLQDIDKRRDELLDLLYSLQTSYGENKQALLAASTGDEADTMIDRLDNAKKGAWLFYRAVTARKAKEMLTTRARTAHLRAHMSRMVKWSMQVNSQSEFEPRSFGGTRKNISRGGQRFPVVWMKRICQLSLKCCGSKVVQKERRLKR